MGVGMPAALFLNDFGAFVYHAFGEWPYHVGSSVDGKLWRDVDVRLMLADEIYERLGFGDPKHPHSNARWVAFCAAFSALGNQMTGLPIDFQIQTLTNANAEFGGCVRSALGTGPTMTNLPAPAETGRARDQLLAEIQRDRANARLLAVHDLADARLRNEPLDEHVRSDLREIERLSREDNE
jgi:hypothetical protein